MNTLTLNLEDVAYDTVKTQPFLTGLRDRRASAPQVQSVAIAQLIPLRVRGTTDVQAIGARPACRPWRATAQL